MFFKDSLVLIETITNSFCNVNQIIRFIKSGKTFFWSSIWNEKLHLKVLNKTTTELIYVRIKDNKIVVFLNFFEINFLL